MTGFERACYADSRASGITYAATGVAVGAVAGLAARSTALVVGTAAAGRMLRTTATDVKAQLDAGDLDGARAALPSLVGRDPTMLDESGVAAAVVESVAENTVDAVVAPALWGAAGGPIGAAAFRAVNTMDAMIGHRSPRYARFGWGSARLDDAAAFVPARVTALLVAVARPRRWRAVCHAVTHDARSHPSPNAGVAEAAFAGALGVQLGGPLRYGDRHEARPLLGAGPRPRPADIDRAVRLADQLELLLAALLATAGMATLVVDKKVRRARG
jgi:adenosylcobinamide-phosphate synthase